MAGTAVRAAANQRGLGAACAHGDAGAAPRSRGRAACVCAGEGQGGSSPGSGTRGLGVGGGRTEQAQRVRGETMGALGLFLAGPNRQDLYSRNFLETQETCWTACAQPTVGTKDGQAASGPLTICTLHSPLL